MIDPFCIQWLILWVEVKIQKYREYRAACKTRAAQVAKVDRYVKEWNATHKSARP